jgi:hypothetical protein
MISGAHAIIYSEDAELDRAFLKDVLGLPHVDVGEGWLIFGLPPSEVAVHPSEENDHHELYLIADDIQSFAAAMGKRGIDCGPLQNMGWGILTQVTLPGGGKLGVYQPRHARPPSPRATRAIAVRRVRVTSTAKKTKKPAKATRRRPAKKRR